MDQNLDMLNWVDVFDDEVDSVFDVGPSRPAPFPLHVLPSAAGVSTPKQCSTPPLVSYALAAQSQASLQQLCGGLLHAAGFRLAASAGTTLSHPPTHDTTPPWHDLQDHSLEASASASQLPPSTQVGRKAPAVPVASARGDPVITAVAPRGRDGPISSPVSKRHKGDLEQRAERQKEQNRKDQQAYRARTRVRPLRGPARLCCPHTAMRNAYTL